jgi:hypothetical protein
MSNQKEANLQIERQKIQKKLICMIFFENFTKNLMRKSGAAGCSRAGIT